MSQIERRERKRKRKKNDDLLKIIVKELANPKNPKNRYAIHSDFVYNGAKKDKDGFWISSNDSEIHARIILSKIATLDLHRILWSRDDTRQYEFDLETQSKTFGLFYLFNKDKKNWFEMQDSFEIVHGGYTQKIPIIFETLTKMSEKEQMAVYWDLD